MDNETTNDQNTNQDTYYYHGLRYWLEGFYMWLAPRLPAGLIYRASDEVLRYADEQGLDTHDMLEAQSLWLIDKMR